MNQLFSEKWMAALKEKWNNSPLVHGPLHKAAFSARIGYGFKGEPRPRGVMSIVNGMVLHTSAIADGKVDWNLDALDDGELDWDLRASPEHWKSWIENGFGVTKLGPAIATHALVFEKGNYRQMIQNPSLSQPFLQHFQLMGEISAAENAAAAKKGKSWF